MGAVAIDTSLRKHFGFYEAYIGKKLVMAVTGVILLGYVVGHLAGNLQIYIPPHIANGEYVYQINKYARLLHSNDTLLWAVRSFLIAAVGLHIWSSFLLWLQKRRARPIGYVKKDDIPSAYASRTMIWSGPIIAAFVVFHILHLTTGSVGLGFEGARDRPGRPGAVLRLSEPGARLPAPGGRARVYRRNRVAESSSLSRHLEHVSVGRYQPSAAHAGAQAGWRIGARS